MALNEKDLVENLKNFLFYMANQIMNSMGKILEKMHGKKVAESSGIEDGRLCLK